MKKSSYADTVRQCFAVHIAVVLSLLCLSGCGGSGADLPETYEVKGKVVQADGNAMSGGLIEFQSTTGPAVTINGEIQQDGTFTLATMFDEERLPGALPGTYRVVIMPMMSDHAEEQHNFEPITVPQTYEVKADAANDFTIKL